MGRKRLINCIVIFFCFCSSIEFAMEEREPAVSLSTLERGIGTSGMDAGNIASILTSQFSAPITPNNFESLKKHIENIREAETLDIQRSHFLEIIHILKGPNVSKDPEKISSAIIQILPFPNDDPLGDAIRNALRRVLKSDTESRDESSGMKDLFAMIQSISDNNQRISDNNQLRRKIKRYKKVFIAVIGAITAVAGAVSTVLPFVISDKQECNCDCTSG